MIKKDHFNGFYDIYRAQQTVRIPYREGTGVADVSCHAHDCYLGVSFATRRQMHILHQGRSSHLEFSPRISAHQAAILEFLFSMFEVIMFFGTGQPRAIYLLGGCPLR